MSAGALVLTAGLVADATGGRLVAGPRAGVFTSVSIDTRTLAPGALFVALKGARDGHLFVPDAIAGGAAGLLVSEAPAAPAALPTIVVSDTLVALQALGRSIRRSSGAAVVAITGSAGKTSTKELTAHLLGGSRRVYRSHGNFNNHIGLPLSLIELVARPDIAVVELGMNHAGEIRRLVELAEPDVRVWTNVGDAHLAYFGSREAVAQAKAEILEHPRPGMVVIANGDDLLVMGHVAGVAAGTEVLTFGTAAGSTIRIRDVEDRGFDGTRAVFETPNGPLTASLSLPGQVHLLNAAAATAVALHFGIAGRDVEARLASVAPVRRRGASVTLPGGGRIVDDSYNASPAAMAAMIEALGRTPARRRVAVLGEMLELGDVAFEKHEACGRLAARVVDVLVAIGGAAADGFVSGALGAGLPADRVHRFADSAAAAGALPALIQPGDVVLVKGSRGTRTDLVADRLVEAA